MKRMQKNHQGSTLVECIAAFAIFSVASFILMIGFLAIGNIVARSVELKNNTNNIINTLETSKQENGIIISETEVRDISFTLGDVNYTSKGIYKSASGGEQKLVEFVPQITDAPSNFIPDTDKPVNGKWPEFDDFENQWSVVNVPKGTTIVYDGVYYIAAQDLDIYPRGSIPSKGWWVQNNNLVPISNRPVINWNGGSQLDFYYLTGGRINKGDKVLWNGDYYVFTIANQTWADPPNLSQHNWALIKYPLA